MASQASTAKAYPLQWPKGRDRAKSRGESRFGSRTLAKSLEALKLELGRLGATYIVVSTNVPLKANGDPYSDPGKMQDPGAAVYFRLKDKPYSLCCDRWTWLEENLYALAKHIEAMRGMDRWGVGSVEQAFAGFKELASSTVIENWWDILECRMDADTETIQRQYRARITSAHPDTGGSHEAMTRLNAARDAALAAVKERR